MKELQTERLLLRKLRADDAQRIFDFWASDPAVTRYITWPPHESVEVTKAVMAGWLAEYEKPDCYRYGIELKESGELIGMIDVVGYRGGCPVIGYCSGHPVWGHGYMTEALRAVCPMLFDEGYDFLPEARDRHPQLLPSRPRIKTDPAVHDNGGALFCPVLALFLLEC